MQLFKSDAQGLGHPQRYVRTVNVMANNVGAQSSASTDPALEEVRQKYVWSQLEIERLNKEIQDISA